MLCADFYAKDRPYIDSFLNSRISRSFVLQTQRFKAEAENLPVDKAQIEEWQKIKAEELSVLVDYARQEDFFDKIAVIAADGNACSAAEDYLKTANLNIPLFKIDDKIPGYINGMGNLSVNQPIAYKIVADAPSDGWIQSQQIALRIEKLKAKNKDESQADTSDTAENSSAETAGTNSVTNKEGN